MLNVEKLTEDEQIALDDLVHDVFSKQASIVNNGGPYFQINCLHLQGWTDSQIESWIGEPEG